MPDLLTVEEAKYALGIGQDDHTPKVDEILPIYIEAVSNGLAKMCGPIVAAGTVVENYDGGCAHIWLDQHPLLSVTSVVEYDGTTPGTLTAETNTTKPTTGYKVNLKNGKLTRRSDNWDAYFPRGSDNVVVTYTPGRYSGGGTLITDDRWRQAAILTLKNAWRSQENNVQTFGEVEVPMASFPRFTYPNAVKELLGDEWRRGSGIGE